MLARRFWNERTNTGNNEWYTPAEYVARVRKALGEIDCDPASTPVANLVMKARTFYTKEQSGVIRRWIGRVFLNPPYSKDLLTRFANKFHYEVLSGSITEAIVLVHNTTECQWWRTFALHASAICLTGHRIEFYAPDDADPNPQRGNSFLYVGDNVRRFVDVFGDVGTVWRK
jgi:DNA N-6-adenine-methyltransferase (Dam)